ncbi:NAD(P)H-dependent oxidoreductase [Sphingomonas sp. 22176]|uniref:NAD(P)H-dependent oxidoreductase n=1 Tax=Sphingomonas sp. 22176 TaxID=3453884 RepID=UPI003F85E3D8
MHDATLAADGPDTPAAGLEHAETYLRGAFAFLGINDLEFVVADGLGIPDTREASIAQAEQQAAALAA